MSENIQLPNQVFPTTHGEVNLAEVDNEWLIIYFYLKTQRQAVQHKLSAFLV